MSAIVPISRNARYSGARAGDTLPFAQREQVGDEPRIDGFHCFIVTERTAIRMRHFP